MLCPTCGFRNEESARFCVTCGQELQATAYRPFRGSGSGDYGRQGYSAFEESGGYRPHVPSYLIPSILVTIFCCLPLGIVAIVFAAQVNGKLAAGDIAGAQSASRAARTLVIVSVVIGLVVIGIAILAGLLGEPPPELINE